MISKGLRAEDALGKIRRVRPFIKPTPSQILALKEFDKSERQRLSMSQSEKRLLNM